MPLLYYPSAGEIVVCRYEDVVLEPEMRKARPVVVVGPRLRRRARLVTVVPLSTTAPQFEEDYHFRLELPTPLPPPFDSPIMWAKCDMVGSVSIDRLDRFKEPRSRYGGIRKWMTGRVDAEQLTAIRRAVFRSLGLESLTNGS